MIYPELNRGDRGNDVIKLQSLLNKVGAMLTADGDFGGGTERGVRYAQDVAGFPQTGTADHHLWQWLSDHEDPFPLLSTDGVAFIAIEETGGLNYYNLHTRWPHFPGYQSGITVGVGYDLRFNTRENFDSTWGPYLDSAHMRELSKDLGVKGSKKRGRELKNMGIDIPFKHAWAVFIASILPRFYRITEGAYPSLDTLPGSCRAVLVSIVFNRGASMNGASRSEMRRIRDILAGASSPSIHKQKRKMLLSDVEDEILSMQRLWDAGSGLVRRRQKEANMWRQGLRDW